MTITFGCFLVTAIVPRRQSKSQVISTGVEARVLTGRRHQKGGRVF